MLSKLASAYVKCSKLFFGYSKYSSVTAMITDLGLPTFDIVLRNARIGFSKDNIYSTTGCTAVLMLLFRQSFKLADAYVLLLCYLACMSLRLFCLFVSVSLSLTLFYGPVCV